MSINDVDGGGGPDAVVSIRDLSVSFATPHRTTHALTNIDLDVRRGRCLCLVGESGSGKTVLSRALLQLIDPPGRIDTGSVVLQTHVDQTGVDILQLPRKAPQLRSIRGGVVATIFQEPMAALSPVHTIGRQMAENLLLHADVTAQTVRTRAEQELAAVGLTEPARVFDSYSFELSGGMRQRAMIAMALSTRPAILIADEPTTALDVTSQSRVLDLLRERTIELGMTMIFVTHDLGVVAEIADDVCVMQAGKVVEAGTVDDVFHAPRASYTKTLLASRPATKSVSAVSRGAGDSAQQASPIVAIENLDITFAARRSRRRMFGRAGAPAREAVRAVRSVNLAVHEGQTLGIVGESGSGKTTVGRTVLGVYRPDAGGVTVRRRDGTTISVADANKEELRELRTDVRMIFQDPYGSLNPRLTVRQLIAESLIVNHLALGSELEDRVAQSVKNVKLPADILSRYPHEFSGGQRQRISIARALVTGPRVVVADEAVSALDASVRANVLDLLAELQQDLGLTYLFISHDLSVVSAICDEVAVMRHGEVVEQGPCHDVFHSPQHEYTQRLLAAVPVNDPRDRTHRPTGGPRSTTLEVSDAGTHR